MTVASLQPLDQNQWQQLVGTFLDYNYRHLWAYSAACADLQHARCEHVAIRSEHKIIGVAAVRIKTIPLLGTGLAYISGGPLIRRGQRGDVAHLAQALQALREEYAVRRGYTLRMQLPPGSREWLEQAGEQYKACGYGISAQSSAYRTIVLDLAPALETIRSRLAQKWRNQLNAAERKEVQIRSGTQGELWEQFIGLFEQLIERKNFQVELDPRFYARIQNEHEAADRLLVSIATHHDRPVAGHIAALHGDTCFYLLGATSAVGLELKAAYLLQWHVIKTAHEQGLQAYDLGGIDPQGNPGVYLFKSRMGGEEITVPGPFEIVPQGIRGYMLRNAETLYRSLRQRRRASSVVRAE